MCCVRGGTVFKRVVCYAVPAGGAAWRFELYVCALLFFDYIWNTCARLPADGPYCCSLSKNLPITLQAAPHRLRRHSQLQT